MPMRSLVYQPSIFHKNVVHLFQLIGHMWPCAHILTTHLRVCVTNKQESTIVMNATVWFSAENQTQQRQGTSQIPMYIHSLDLTTTSLQCQNISERHHNSLSHLRTGRADQGPCDYLCSHGGQTLLLQSLWICAGSLYFQQSCCPHPDDQGEYPLYVESWSSSM